MKVRGSLFLLFLLTNILVSYSQYDIVINAFVLDQNTKKPIAYANIGFVDKAIGTVSNTDGKFNLRFDEEKVSKNDVIQFSGMGYEPLTLTHKQLSEILIKDNKIQLRPTASGAYKTVVSFEESRLDSIGYVSYDSDLLAYWKDKKALGSQIGTLIKVRKKNTKLLNLKFNIVENTTDSLLVRVNLYKNENGKPGASILTDNIYHTISNTFGEETIDISAYDIVVADDFIASIELLAVYGKRLRFAITANRIGYSYIKNGSQNLWDLRKDIGVAFKVHTSNPPSSYEPEKRKNPEHITMYWDTSLSMQDKDLDKEINFLRTYFATIKNTQLNFVAFSNDAAKTKSFTIENGNVHDLIEEIKNIRYDGATNFSRFFREQNKPDQYVVFTDGYYNYGKPEFIYDVPVFYISSKEDSNHLQLQQAANFAGGFYINLSKIEVPKAQEYIINKVEDRTTYIARNSSEEQVFGTVISRDQPIQGCKVSVKGTMVRSETNSNGAFSVKATTGNVLGFEHFGFEDREVLLDVAKEIKVALEPKFNVLEEVKLSDTEQVLDEEVNMGGITKDKRKIGFANYTLTKEEFPDAVVYLADLIRYQFPAIKVVSSVGNSDNSIYIGRARSIQLSTAPLFVVDGIPFERAPNYLMPAMIESITYTPGISGAARYGSLGRNGVFFITTNVAPSVLGKKEEKVNHFLATDNEYKEPDIKLVNQDNIPAYLNTLWRSTTYHEAVDRYYQLREYHEQEATFYIYCFEYFKKWNSDFSKQVLSNLTEIANNNYSVLRALAFRLEELGDKESAMLIYESVFEIKPNYAQSYLDLARIYKDNERYQEAFEIYKLMLQNKEHTVDFTAVKPQVTSQLRHLLNLNRIAVSYSDVPRNFLIVKSAPVRIVFDWNDPEAEFDLQFVNPKNKYYKWSNRSGQKKQSTPKDVSYGALSKEFIIDDSFQGQWIVNLEANGDASKYDSTFLKYTIFRNYGLQNETKTVKFIKLHNQEEKVTLDKFTI